MDNDTQMGAQAAQMPIGIFDSGVGGFTVAKELIKLLPRESFIYFGDTFRCPYGPRTLDEVRVFVRQICSWLDSQRVKMIVIACNTATAAGLEMAQREFSVPVVGVVEPGARAAVFATENRRIGVIATQATIESGAYTRAIRSHDAGITVFSTATPRFVEIAEEGLRLAPGMVEDLWASVSKVYVRPAFQEIARDYLDPLKRCGIDTLVMGCTHFPLLKTLIGAEIGHEVKLISSSEETAHEVHDLLERRGLLATGKPHYRFITTASDIEEFRRIGSLVLDHDIQQLEQVNVHELESGLEDARA